MGPFGHDKHGAKGSKSAKAGGEIYKNKEHKNKGFKNVYHKEEYGDQKNYNDEFKDSDYKKKHADQADYYDKDGGKYMKEDNKKHYNNAKKHGEDYHKHGKKGYSGHHDNEWKKGGKHHSSDDEHKKHGGKYHKDDFDSSKHKHGGSYHKKGDYGSDYKDGKDYGKKYGGGEYHSSGYSDGGNEAVMEAVTEAIITITKGSRSLREETSDILSTRGCIVPIIADIDTPPPDLRDVIRSEIQQTLAPISAPPQPESFRPRRQYIPQNDQGYRRRTEGPPNNQRTQWRTEDDRPICFHCGRPGHVAPIKGLKVKIRSQIRRMDRYLASIDEDISGSDLHKLKLIDEGISEIKTETKILFDELFEQEEVDEEKELESYETIQDKMEKLEIKLKRASEGIQSTAEAKQAKGLETVKLPKFVLPHFYGEANSWFNFKEVFGIAIDQNPGLNDLQKLQYSGSPVKGEAARLIRGFPISSESYKQAWDTLVSRYDNQRELANAQLNKIFKIKQMKNPSTKALRELLDTCNESVRNLGSLGLQRNEFSRHNIGADMYAYLMHGEKKMLGRNQPIAMKSKLGWVLMGKVDSSLSSNYKGGPCSFTVQTTSELDGLVRNFRESESVPSLQDQKTREEDYETYYMKTYSRNCQGRYSVKLLFRKAHLAHTSPFPNSYSSHTSQRLMPIENSMSRANSEAKISPHLGHCSIISEVNRNSPQAAHQNSSIPTSKSPIIPLRGMSSENILYKTNLDSRRSFQETNHQAGPTFLYASRSELKFSGGGEYFSTMDMRSGYWQIEVDDKDREKTAFITPDGLYEFNVMPFGLCNAPATFERMIDNVLRGLKWDMCLCYLDDIVVYGSTFKEHLTRLYKVLRCIQQAGLCLNYKRCNFASRQITILGHVINEFETQPDPEKVKAIVHFPKPRNISETRSFLGLSSYYRRFIKSYANKSRPLNSLLKKDEKFIWGEEQDESFRILKQELRSSPVLGHFVEGAETHVHTDASGYGLGAVLVQIQNDAERPIAYASRTLTKAEKNYSTTEKECLAVVWALGKFRMYLYGRAFTVVTNHHSLCWLVGLKEPSGRLARWALKLQEYDINIVYQSGRKHKDADCLSRSPLADTAEIEGHIISIQDVAEEQSKDPHLVGIREKLANENLKGYQMIGGVLYKKIYDPEGKPWLIVVPKQMRHEILKDFHDTPLAGHLGMPAKEGRASETPGLLVPIPPTTSPFQKIGIDYLGRFPISHRGNRWIIVATDYLTRFAITKAATTAEATELATFLIEDVILKHGAPWEIITDRGRNFMFQTIREINTLNGTIHRFTTAYHPQTNGLTERLNKTLTDMISMYVDVDQKSWDSILPYVTFAYNTARQETTGYSSFFLVHGREVETPLDSILPYQPAGTAEDYVGHLVANAEDAQMLARLNILQAQSKDKERYDKKHQEVTYKEGDLVWVFTLVRTVGLSEKLLKRYFGPYRVIRKISSVNYQVEGVTNTRRRRKTQDIVHVVRMKPYHEPEVQEQIAQGHDYVTPPQSMYNVSSKGLINVRPREIGKEQSTGLHHPGSKGHCPGPIKLKFKGLLLPEGLQSCRHWRIFQGLISTLQLVERLDRYPLRNKRKIDSVEPEETSMNVKKEGTQVSNYVVQHLPRNPSIFSGEDGEDLQKWLKGYARVARYNHWDETLCLTKVYFYLSETALKWFENNEESIQTWKEFTSQLENVFGKKENSKLQAVKKLKTRAQLKGESTEFYIQDVLCLCKEVDPQMSAEDKISHLMKGIAEELYQALLPRDVQSTEQFITECRRVEALRCRRVTPTRYERLPNVASLCDQDDGEDLSSLIRKIVREEIQQALDSPQEEPKIAANEDLVREEIVKTLAPISEPTISPPQAPRPVSNPKFEAQPRNPHPTSQYQKQGRRRDTNEWRTTEGRPICFYCGRPGHVVRYCRDRKKHNEERRKDYFQRKQAAMDRVELKEMTVKKEEATQVGNYFVQHLPRNPSMFSGEDGEDPHTWLKGYNRVAKYNHWDETLCLANVYFYLNGTALKWFENNEETIRNWGEFNTQLESVFGKSESLRLLAEKKLKIRAQLKGESTEFYIQDVLRLCKEVDLQMSEEDKISHLMKGIVEELYQALLPKDINNTDQFVSECRRIEALHRRRVTPAKYERLPNVASLDVCNDNTDLSSMIRQIVREEVQRALAAPREEPRIATIEDMVREEIDKTLAPITNPSRGSPKYRTYTPSPIARRETAAPQIPRPRARYPKQGERLDTSEWRTTEGRPICFHCGRPGHVARNCRDRRRQNDERENGYSQGRQEPMFFYGSRPKFPALNDDEPRDNFRRYRSPSPYPGRNGQHSSPIRGSKGNITSALVDSGASYSVVSERFRLKLKKIMFAETDVSLRVANGKIIKPKGRCSLKLDLNGLQENFEFIVLEDCSHDVILGWDFLKLSRAVIDSAEDKLFLEEFLVEDTPRNNSPLYAEREYRIEPASCQLIEVLSRDISDNATVVAESQRGLSLERELMAPSSIISLTSNRGKLWVANWSPYPKIIPQGMHVADGVVIEDSQLCVLAEGNHVGTDIGHSEDSKFAEILNIDDSLDDFQKEKLRNLLRNYRDIFDFRKKEASKTDNVKHRISTGDHLPTKQRPYRVAPAERQIIQEEVNKMEEIGIIQPSASPWASPVVLVRKKDGSWRFCVDYRRLNKITKKDVYPLPRIDDTLDCLQGARFYSSMDLQSGYWQIDVEESDREKTAFITPDGLYEFKVMPFGLCNAPATFERMMDGLLKGLRWTICLCYLDDIVVFSDDFEEHLRRLQLVLGCLRKAGLCLNPGKCRFGAKTITVLGHKVSGDGICLDPEKIRAVRDFPRPKSLKEVRSFLGLSSYYRRFIPNYAHMAQPLNALLKKDSVFSWNIEERHAFEALKSALISEPVLGHFDHSSPTEIHTDASNYGIGAVLVQIQKGKERAIAYASRTLNKAERNYSTTERECLAVIWAIGKFRPYVFGRQFTIVTDHHSLCWLANLKDPCGRLARWALRLQEFDVTVVHKSGRKHQDADCLSRSPLNCSEDIEEDIPCIVALQNFTREQMKDPDLTKIADKIQQETSNKSFIKINDTLHKKNYDPMGREWLLVVPRHLRPEILRNLHDYPTSGHLGFTKTYDRIRKKFYWPGMYRNVRKYVAHCPDCQRRKRQPQLPPGLLQPIPVPIAAFEKVGMDLLGRFPTSMCGNRWIIVCTDYLTKFAITKALPTSESVEVAKFFIKDVILKHGAPREVITDRGRNFTSSMIRDLNKHCRIIHRTTTAYHPQTNGLTERLNKTIADMLSMYVDVNQKDWDEILPFVTFAYNTAKQESTGFSPFYLVHGREAETPLDLLFPKFPSEDEDDFIQTLGSRAEEARQLARIHTMRSQGENKLRYDAHHRNIVYQPGDLVWIYIPVRKVGLSEKLMRRYFGPYRVTRKISDVTYEVETFGDQHGRRKTKDIVHICRMKPYLDPEEREDHLEEDMEDNLSSPQGEEVSVEGRQPPLAQEEVPRPGDLDIPGPVTRSRARRLEAQLASWGIVFFCLLAAGLALPHHHHGHHYEKGGDDHHSSHHGHDDHSGHKHGHHSGGYSDYKDDSHSKGHSSHGDSYGTYGSGKKHGSDGYSSHHSSGGDSSFKKGGEEFGKHHMKQEGLNHGSGGAAHGAYGHDKHGAKGSKSGKAGGEFYQNKEHKNKGFKNVYHKEEYGDQKNYNDEFKDSDYKKKHADQADYYDKDGGKYMKEDNKKHYNNAKKHGEDYHKHGKKGYSGHHESEWKKGGKHHSSDDEHKKHGGKYHKDDFDSSKHKHGGSYHKKGDYGSDYKDDKDYGKKYGGGEYHSSGYSDGGIDSLFLFILLFLPRPLCFFSSCPSVAGLALILVGSSRGSCSKKEGDSSTMQVLKKNTTRKYLRELRHLAMDCTFGEMLEVMLRDRFVAGMKSESFQKKFLQEDDGVFSIAVSFELAEQNAKELQDGLVAKMDIVPGGDRKNEARRGWQHGPEWTWPEKPWHRLHFDLAGPFMGRIFMVLVDAYTKWLEIIIIKDITSRTIIGHLREIFARFGLPEILVSDNGRQFVSSEFEEFTIINGIRHTKTSPYNPSTNGLAERYVREFKNSLRKNQGKDSIEINLQRFLFTHRAFPQTVLKESPAELLMKRSLRSRFSNLIPKMAKVGEVYHDAVRKQEHFSVGSDVYFRSFANGPKWKRGRIMELLSSRHYLIEDEGRYMKRHINQLRPVIKKEVPEVRDLVLLGTSRDFMLPGTSRDHPRLGGQEKKMEEAPEVDEELKGAESSAQEDTPEPEPGPAAAAISVP
ncbi:hypothetical protein LAZ67_2006231, partial [Cordylochernes scorpioides]